MVPAAPFETPHRAMCSSCGRACAASCANKKGEPSAERVPANAPAGTRIPLTRIPLASRSAAHAAGDVTVSTVRGYTVRIVRMSMTPAEARERRNVLAQLLARSFMK